jgi:hypothetical protein
VTGIWGPSLDIVNVKTTAIAAFPMLPGGQTCLLAVGSDTTVSATLNLPNCALASLSTSGSSIVLSGSGDSIINAAAIATAGNIVIGSSATLPPHTYTYFPLQDPYKGVTKDPLSGLIPPGHCSGSGITTINSGTYTLPSTTFYCGLTISGNANVTFSGGIYYIGAGGISINGSPIVKFGPGVYYLDGGNFSITGSASVIGTDITVVLTSIAQVSAGGIDIENNACSATISLSGTKTGQGLLRPSAKASQGLLFFQDPTGGGSTGNTITTGVSDFGCNVALNGVIYTPASAVNLKGNVAAGAKGCTEIISQSFIVNGNTAVDDTGCSGITLNQAQIQQVYLVM